MKREITKEELYQYQLKNRDAKTLEKAKRNNCDGLCYWGKGMCPLVETCPETATGEFIATLVGIFAYIAIFILAIGLLAVTAFAAFSFVMFIISLC